MKNRKTTLLIAVFLVFALMLSACGGSSSTPGKTDNSSNNASQNNESAVKLTFDQNYEGAPAAEVVEVAYGTSPEDLLPADPERAGYQFEGWFTDKEATDEADFSRAAAKDATYYAKWRQTDVTVIFDENYEGGKSSEATVAIGQTVARPSSPEREGFLFGGWFTDAEGTAEFDFDTALSEGLTLFAKWEEDLGDNVAVTYMWNYEGAPDNGVYDKAVMQKNKKPKLAQVSREGYYFAGWCTDKECTTVFDSSQRLNNSVTLYARWYTIYTFEAEHVDVSEIKGMGYSGNADGLGIIESDVYSMNASNEHYVGWLYNEGITLEFNLTSDKAVEDACLVLRLSGEFAASGTITIKCDEFTVEVNGTPLTYGDLVIDNVTDASSDQKRPFSDFMVSTKVALNEGANVIRLIVSNNIHGEGGTMYATAPMVDCIKVYSNSTVEWGEGFPLTSNVRY